MGAGGVKVKPKVNSQEKGNECVSHFHFFHRFYRWAELRSESDT